ncbi:hypothetical protein OH77DRAFT_528912 [Trametes cingulata]|nr:hypothetical protein OH77DRAFT_528912 [Trametes cingulata]
MSQGARSLARSHRTCRHTERHSPSPPPPRPRPSTTPASNPSENLRIPPRSTAELRCSSSRACCGVLKSQKMRPQMRDLRCSVPILDACHVCRSRMLCGVRAAVRVRCALPGWESPGPGQAILSTLSEPSTLSNVHRKQINHSPLTVAPTLDQQSRMPAETLHVPAKPPPCHHSGPAGRSGSASCGRRNINDQWALTDAQTASSREDDHPAATCSLSPVVLGHSHRGHPRSPVRTAPSRASEFPSAPNTLSQRAPSVNP